MRNVTIAVAGLLAIVLLTRVAGIAKDPPAAKPDNRFFVIVVPPPLTSAPDLWPPSSDLFLATLSASSQKPGLVGFRRVFSTVCDRSRCICAQTSPD